ncbi:hypothetical protein BKA64DRAFT_5643 [Cadophora sp. MPI-SDFR-AT-0126]|nr:hypothetical protein BKA64DRAFT_5643 [Leotiomycetes sp. MPI-SDFR-AT-0126]
MASSPTPDTEDLWGNQAGVTGSWTRWMGQDDLRRSIWTMFCVLYPAFCSTPLYSVISICSASLINVRIFPASLTTLLASSAFSTADLTFFFDILIKLVCNSSCFSSDIPSTLPIWLAPPSVPKAMTGRYISSSSSSS